MCIYGCKVNKAGFLRREFCSLFECVNVCVMRVNVYGMKSAYPLHHFRGHGNNLCPSLLPDFPGNDAKDAVSNGLPCLGEHDDRIDIKDDPSPIQTSNG